MSSARRTVVRENPASSAATSGRKWTAVVMCCALPGPATHPLLYRQEELTKVDAGIKRDWERPEGGLQSHWSCRLRCSILHRYAASSRRTHTESVACC